MKSGRRVNQFGRIRQTRLDIALERLGVTGELLSVQGKAKQGKAKDRTHTK